MFNFNYVYHFRGTNWELIAHETAHRSAKNKFHCREIYLLYKEGLNKNAFYSDYYRKNLIEKNEEKEKEAYPSFGDW